MTLRDSAGRSKCEQEMKPIAFGLINPHQCPNQAQIRHKIEVDFDLLQTKSLPELSRTHLEMKIPEYPSLP